MALVSTASRAPRGIIRHWPYRQHAVLRRLIYLFKDLFFKHSRAFLDVPCSGVRLSVSQCWANTDEPIDWHKRKIMQAARLKPHPSGNFAARLVRLISPLNILVNESFAIDPLYIPCPFTHFRKFSLFVPNDLHAPL